MDYHESWFQGPKCKEWLKDTITDVQTLRLSPNIHPLQFLARSFGHERHDIPAEKVLQAFDALLANSLSRISGSYREAVGEILSSIYWPMVAKKMKDWTPELGKTINETYQKVLEHYGLGLGKTVEDEPAKKVFLVEPSDQCEFIKIEGGDIHYQARGKQFKDGIAHALRTWAYGKVPKTHGSAWWLGQIAEKHSEGYECIPAPKTEGPAEAKKEEPKPAREDWNPKVLSLWRVVKTGRHYFDPDLLVTVAAKNTGAAGMFSFEVASFQDKVKKLQPHYQQLLAKHEVEFVADSGPKFEIGQKVRINAGLPNKHHGKIAKVTNVVLVKNPERSGLVPHSFGYKVDFAIHPSESPWNWLEHSLELVDQLEWTELELQAKRDESNKFKRGDRVKITKITTSSIGALSPLLVGKTGTVHATYPTSSDIRKKTGYETAIEVRIDGKPNHWFVAEELELLPAEETPAQDLKVGDRVRVNWSESRTHNQEGVIKEISKTTVEVKLDNYSGMSIFFPNRLVKIEQKPVEKESEAKKPSNWPPKEGSIWRVVSYGHGGIGARNAVHHFPIGLLVRAMVEVGRWWRFGTLDGVAAEPVPGDTFRVTDQLMTEHHVEFVAESIDKLPPAELPMKIEDAPKPQKMSELQIRNKKLETANQRLVVAVEAAVKRNPQLSSWWAEDYNHPVHNLVFSDEPGGGAYLSLRTPGRRTVRLCYSWATGAWFLLADSFEPEALKKLTLKWITPELLDQILNAMISMAEGSEQTVKTPLPSNAI